MRKLLLIAVLLLAGCSAGRWEQTGREVPCMRCDGDGLYANPYGRTFECEQCGGDGQTTAWKWVQDAKKPPTGDRTQEWERQQQWK